MTPELTELARRAVACKGWRWMPGMAYEERGRKYRVDESYLASARENWHHGCTLVLSDPATLGCLLALVREAWRCPTVYVRQGTTRRVSDGVLAWEVCDLCLDTEACRALGVDRQGSVGSWGHGSEAEALVDALEAAP